MKNYKQKSTDTLVKDRQLKTPPVTDYMTRDLITFTAETEMYEVVDSLLSNRITGAPVLNTKGEVVGVIDDKDCLKMLYAGAYYNHPVAKDTVASYMDKEWKSISIDADLLDATKIFVETKFKRLLVIDAKGKLAGQISRRDVVRAMKDMHGRTW